MIQYIKGNLLETKLFGLGHVVNCMGVFGSGLALQIKLKYPECFTAYKQFNISDSLKFNNKLYAPPEIGMNYSRSERLGKTHIWEGSGGRSPIIFNIHGQDNFGRERRQLNYEAFYTGIEQVKIYLDFTIKNDKTLAKQLVEYGIGFPSRIGSDRAGGNWKIVCTMLEEVFLQERYPVYIVELEK